VNGFDRQRYADELIVYGPEFHRTTLTAPGGGEALVENDRVAAAIDGAGSLPIPAAGYVVSAAGTAAADTGLPFYPRISRTIGTRGPRPSSGR
jgi:hypothetical protein